MDISIISDDLIAVGAAVALCGASVVLVALTLRVVKWLNRTL